MKFEEYKVKVWEDGTVEWFNSEGKLHRLGGLPASESSNGHKLYLENGKLHRSGGLPAVEYSNGDKEYYENNKLHRIDGPAVDFVNGTKQYWLFGKCYDTKKQYDKEVKKLTKTVSHEGKEAVIDGITYTLVKKA